MPQTTIPRFFNLFGTQYLSLLDEAQIIPVETYTATPNSGTCNYLERGNNTMDLSRVDIPAEDLDNGYTAITPCAIAVFCRAKYNSIDYPDNPRFPNL